MQQRGGGGGFVGSEDLLRALSLSDIPAQIASFGGGGGREQNQWLLIGL